MVKHFAIFLLVLLWPQAIRRKLNHGFLRIGAGLFYIFVIINWQDCNKTSAFQILLIMGGGFCAVEFLFSTGAAKWIAMRILDTLGLVGASTATILLVLMIFTQYIRVFFQGTTKLATIFVPILIAMAITLNVPPEVIAMPAGMLISGFPFLMFYNTNPNVVVYGSGYINIWDFPKYGLPICTVAIIFYLGVAVTYWKWLGLY
jgi:di/tricarboxylate transporter